MARRNIEHRIEELERYYRERAPEYEEIYNRSDPVRKKEFARAAARLRQIVRARRVLEVACGTGFWTEIASESAADIVATDVNEAMIDEARQKNYKRDNVQLVVGNAYELDSIAGEFDAGLACFWMSHVPKSRMDKFLRVFHRQLRRDSVVFMIDNTEAAGVGGQLLQEPGSEDTFKLRELNDGSKHTVIKNYFRPEDLTDLLAPHARDLSVEFATYYWWLSYRTR
jgi:ubiquinone/menaquinone biosynthesis C-methylase UbiE